MRAVGDARRALGRRSAGPSDTQLARLALAAERYLRQSLRQDLSIADLCRATGASERTLHLAFRQHIGPSPKAYRKALLLNAARRDLAAGRPETTVTRVANHWGFKHLSWFAHDYKALCGESPHESLRAASPSMTQPAAIAVSG